MAGYIGSKTSVAQVDGYTRTEADAGFVSVAGDTMTGSLSVGGIASGGLNTFVNPSGASYNENLRLPRSGSGYVSIAMGSDPNASSGALSNQWTQVVYPSSHPTQADYFAIRRGSGPEAIRIDTAGRVTMPYQPVISGQIGTAMTNPAAPQLIDFNEFWSSVGITYNSTTRRFTVPVAGKYRITLNPFWLQGAGIGRVMVGVNNDAPVQTTHYGHTYKGSNDYETGCINSVVSLSANDYVVFKLFQGTLYSTPGDRFNQFSIQLIG